jgi:hypothetical protein
MLGQVKSKIAIEKLLNWVIIKIGNEALGVSMENLSNNMVLCGSFLFESYAEYGELSRYIEGYTRVSKWVNGWWQPFGKLRIVKSEIFFGFDWVYLTGEDKENHSLVIETLFVCAFPYTVFGLLQARFFSYRLVYNKMQGEVKASVISRNLNIL